MKSKDIKIAGLITVFVLVVAISGCTSSNQVQNKTFSNGGITLQYPGTWSDNVSFNYTQAPSSDWTALGTIGDNTISVALTSMNLSNSTLFSSTPIESLARLAYSTSKTAQSLSFNTSTNANNITFYELIYTNADPVTNITYKSYQLYFGKQGQIIYTIIFKTKETDFQNNYQQMKGIQSSIKYT